ncbi:hypothetical protein MM742_004524 [Salmonella enterica]|nr:hypothetical protein [Salmonella enterica]
MMNNQSSLGVDVTSPFESPVDNLLTNLVYGAVGFVALIAIIYVTGVVFKNNSLKETAAGFSRRLVVIGAAAGCVAVIFLLVTNYFQEKADWNEFASEHCQIIEKKDGQQTSGVGLTLRGHIGAFTGSSSSQTVYKCDDGVIYTKNN